jgi:hypothetical protein
MSDFAAGDVVWGFFHYAHDDDGKNRYALVLDVDEDGQYTRLYLSYGSKQKVSVSGHLDHELVIAASSEIAMAGIKRATRFDLMHRMWVDADDYEVVGNIGNPAARSCLLRFYKAAKAAGLLSGEEDVT